jgi:hypothetical protein
MANRVTGYNRMLDTFGADVTISTDPIYVSAIIVTGYTTAKTVTFIDADSALMLTFEVPADGTSQFTPSVPIYFGNGLVFDESASDLEANDLAFIFVHKWE